MYQQKIINIQFLRTIAALVVVLYHTSAHYFVVSGDDNTLNIFTIMSKIGYIGVDIFFVISGYIMWITTKDKYGLADALKFLYARLTRVYLTYWIFLIFMIYYYHHSLNHFDLIGSIFLTVHSSSKLLLEVAWTLQYELYFYGLFTLLLFVPRKYFFTFFLSLSFLIIGVQTYGIIEYNIYAKNIFNEASTFYTFWTSPFILEFFLGCFVGYFFESHRIRHISVLIIGLLAICLLAIWYKKEYIVGTYAEGYFLPYRVLFLGTASMLLLALMVEWNKRNIIIFPTFSLLVGNASYSLYLGHNIILLFLYEIGIRDWIKNLNSYYHLWLMLLIVILITLYSIMHYKIIEAPLMRWAKMFGNRFLLKINHTF